MTKYLKFKTTRNDIIENIQDHFGMSHYLNVNGFAPFEKEITDEVLKDLEKVKEYVTLVKLKE